MADDESQEEPVEENYINGHVKDTSGSDSSDDCTGGKKVDDKEQEEEIEEEDSGKRAHHTITGRGVTLKMLLADKIIEPGDNLLSIDYLGQTFLANMLQSGKIYWAAEKKTFNSPSAWAIYCKRMVNPSKKSGCGWASVKYKGKKLDVYKTSWFRKQHAESLMVSIPDNETDENGMTKEPSSRKRKSSSNSTLPSPEGSGTFFNKNKKTPIKHSSLGKKSDDIDKTTPVECITFNSQGKIQPFTVSISTNCLLIMDYHSHLTMNEVVGYLAGKWDPQSQHLNVYLAFPCKSGIGNTTEAARVEKEIQEAIEQENLIPVGWYHSHPHFQADPSIQDIESQLAHQTSLKGPGNNYYPCLGVIVAPYDINNHSKHKESSIKAFWVAPPANRDEYGIPLLMNYNISQDIFLTQESMSELRNLTDFYRSDPNRLNFTDNWQHSMSNIDKLKLSLAKKYPKNQSDGQYIEMLYNILYQTYQSLDKSVQ